MNDNKPSKKDSSSSNIARDYQSFGKGLQILGGILCLILIIWLITSIM